MAKFVSAYESGDLDALVALLTDAVFMSMPPMALEYAGRDLVASFCALLFASGRQFRLVPTRANGQPAFGLYVLAPDGVRQASGFITIALSGERIGSMTRFESTVLPAFGMLQSLPR